jgi:hypothetical protein
MPVLGATAAPLRSRFSQDVEDDLASENVRSRGKETSDVEQVGRF